MGITKRLEGEMAAGDRGVLSRIGELVEQEKSLRSRRAGKALGEQDRLQLEEVEAELDQCWDLLNQRRALREFGMDPSRAQVRDEETVEDYLQ